MSLKDQINEEIKSAMKTQNKVRLETVRSIKKLILEKEVALRGEGQPELTPIHEMDLLSQLAKQRRDSIDQYQRAGRMDLADLEAQELVIIEEYLPQQLTEAEISAKIDTAIVSVGATSVKDMGKVMGALMADVKGRADGKKVQEMVKAKLA